MNEQDKLELQALVDGELDAAAEERLRQRLGDGAEASQLERELRSLAQALDAVPEPAVPNNLEQRILQRAPLPVDRRAETVIIARLPKRERPQWQGFALAASLFVAVIVGVGALFPDEMNPQLADQMTGSLLPQADRLGGAGFEWEDVEADVSLLRNDAGLSLQIRADANEPVLLRVRAEGGETIFAELAVAGEQKLVYPVASEMQALQIDVVREGRVVHSRSLDLSGD